MLVTLIMAATLLGSDPNLELAATLELAPRLVEVGDPIFARVLIVNPSRDAITLRPQVLTSDAGAVSYEFRAADRDAFESPRLFRTSCYVNPPAVSLKAGDSYAVYDVLPPIRTRAVLREPGEYQVRAVVRVGGRELTTEAIPIRIAKSGLRPVLTEQQWLYASTFINAEGVAGLGPIPKEILDINDALPEGHLKTHLEAGILLWRFRNTREPARRLELLQQIERTRESFPPIIQETYRILMANCYMGMEDWNAAIRELDALGRRGFRPDSLRDECEYELADKRPD